MILIITEKKSVADVISKVIGADKGEKGYYIGNDYIVSWCKGHLIRLVEPEAYSAALGKWSIDTLPIIPETYRTEIISQTSEQYALLKDLMNQADITEIICATNAEREGELTFRLVYEKTGCRKAYKRLWINSLDEAAIRNGMNNLKPGSEYDNMYKAALCRMKTDWLIGMNFSRLYSLIYSMPLQIGRFLTPIVNLSVRRQNEIDSFISEYYYIIKADCGRFNAFTKVRSKHTADKIKDRCNGKEAFVTKYESTDYTETAPVLYDLTELQRDANKHYGYTAKQTLEAAQSLYETKLITFPNTSGNFITADMSNSVVGIIHELTKSNIIDAATAASYDIERIDIQRIISNATNESPAIIPLQNAAKTDIERLPTTEANILRLIAHRLLAAPYADYKYTSCKVYLDIEGEAFTGMSIVERDRGYKAIYDRLNTKQEKEDAPDEPANDNLPELNEKDLIKNVFVSCQEKQSKAPVHYTEDTLLKAMNEYGLGTPATQADTIEKAIKHGYISRVGKYLIPKDKSIILMPLLPGKIKDPALTAELEKQLTEINNGNLDSAAFMENINKYVAETVTGAKWLYDPSIKDTTFKESRAVVGVCPRCGKDVVELQYSFACTSGKSGCGFNLWKEDNFFKNKNTSLTRDQAIELLSDGKARLPNLYSTKAKTYYTATVTYEDTGKYINYKLLFDDNNKEMLDTKN